jgi:hypothetical protein
MYVFLGFGISWFSSWMPLLFTVEISDKDRQEVRTECSSERHTLGEGN